MTVSVQEIQQQINALPPESLPELSNFVNYLLFKLQKTKTRKKKTKPLKIVDLEGIAEGCDFSPELLAEARREMWRKFQD